MLQSTVFTQSGFLSSVVKKPSVIREIPEKVIRPLRFPKLRKFPLNFQLNQDESSKYKPIKDPKLLQSLYQKKIQQIQLNFSSSSPFSRTEYLTTIDQIYDQRNDARIHSLEMQQNFEQYLEINRIRGQDVAGYLREQLGFFKGQLKQIKMGIIYQKKKYRYMAEVKQKGELEVAFGARKTSELIKK